MGTMDIDTFKQNFFGDGARACHFHVHLKMPGGSESEGAIPYLVHATSVPAWTINKIPVPYMGRHIYVAGHRTLEPWTVSLILDQDLKLRDSFEAWSNKINGFYTNVRDSSMKDESSYKVQAQVFQLDKTGQNIREYNLNGVWPVSVGQVRLDYALDEICVCDIEFSFDELFVQGSSGSAGGKL
jgi:hypothetical protein